MSKCACLIVEGKGDVVAVPLLLRKVLHEKLKNFSFQIISQPIRAGAIPALRAPGKLEYYLNLACMRKRRKECDCIIVILDCDDDCPRDVAKEFITRALPYAQGFSCPIAFGFIKREFESLFLNSIDSIVKKMSPVRRMDLDKIKTSPDLEEVRDAKSLFYKSLQLDNYKEAKEQAGFVDKLDLAVLHARSRSYRHVETLIDWIVQAGPEKSLVYPNV